MDLLELQREFDELEATRSEPLAPVRAPSRPPPVPPPAPVVEEAALENLEGVERPSLTPLPDVGALVDLDPLGLDPLDPRRSSVPPVGAASAPSQRLEPLPEQAAPRAELALQGPPFSPLSLDDQEIDASLSALDDFLSDADFDTGPVPQVPPSVQDAPSLGAFEPPEVPSVALDAAPTEEPAPPVEPAPVPPVELVPEPLPAPERASLPSLDSLPTELEPLELQAPTTTTAIAPDAEEPPALRVTPEAPSAAETLAVSDAEVELTPSVSDAEVELTPSGSDAEVELTGSDADAVLSLEVDDAELELGGEEEDLELEVPAPAPDRGALLAATVTSKKRQFRPGDEVYAADARAEVLARVELLLEEAEHAASPSEASELQALAADLLGGALGEHDRARELLKDAHRRDPEGLLATRILRREELAAGNHRAALALCDVEAAGELSPEERTALGLFSAELAARIDPSDAAERWASLAAEGGPVGTLSGVFAGAVRKDPGALAEALERFASTASPALAAAADVTRARLAEGTSERASALAAVQDVVKRDPTDVGAWLAMARIGAAREQAGVFRQALLGLAGAGGDAPGATAIACASVARALDGVLGDPVAPGAVEDAGVAGWLVAHALRDAGGEHVPQVSYGTAHAAPGDAAAWRAWDPGVRDPETDAGRYHALRRAVGGRDPAALARAAGALVGGANAARVEAGLLAREGSVASRESEALTEAGELHARLGAALGASTDGLTEAEAFGAARASDAWHRLAALAYGAQSGMRELAREGFAALAEEDVPLGLMLHAMRASATLSQDPEAWVTTLRSEATLAADPKRAAGLKLLVSAAAAGAGGDGTAEAVEASEALPGDVAAAEMVVLHTLRGELPGDVGADMLVAAAGDRVGLWAQMARVRAALRRAVTDPDAASEAIWDAWRRDEDDAPLGVLVLRSPAGDQDRVIAALRAQASRATGPAGVALGMLLSGVLAQAGRATEAAQAIARARTFALQDPALEAEEEARWLQAEMYSEVAERAFEQLKSAQDDEQRVAAYEKLAELDRTYRGDVASSVLSYQAILELAPGHMASLRTLERYFLEQGRYDELLGIYDRLVRHAGDPDDATAFAHAAARLAVAQADGDLAAGGPFWRAAFERGAVDRRLLVALDGECRRAGDLTRFAEVEARLAESTSDPSERATYASRTGEALAALGVWDGALAAFGRAVEAEGGHPTALAGLAWVKENLGDDVGAAEALGALGRALKVAEGAGRAHFRAALRWQERVGDKPRALAALREVLAREPSHAEAFPRAVGILRELDDRAGELELTEQRASAGGEPSAVAALHTRAAELAEGLGDVARARLHWREVVKLEPERDSALRPVSRLAVATQDWTAAADAMIRLAKLTTDPAERVELLFGLGDIYDCHLPDVRRAEAAFRRVLQLAPSDARTLRRLADLYARTGDAAREAEVVRALVEHTEPGTERVTLLLRLARVLDEGLQEAVRAEETLEVARLEAPMDLAVLRAYAGFYERQGNTDARHALLDRAAAEVRGELIERPTDAGLLEHLADVLALRGREDGAKLVASIAVALGTAGEALRPLAPDATVQGAEAGALVPDVLDLLAPPAVTASTRDLLGLVAEVVEKLVPFNPASLRAERLGARPHPLRPEVDRWARILGIGHVEIFLANQLPWLCLPVGRSPAAVVVSVGAALTPATRFAVARAMLLMALSLPLVVRLSAQELTLVLAAVLRQFEPMYSPEGVDQAQLLELTRKITRALPHDRHAEAMPFAFEVIAQLGADGEAVQTGALELGDRLALLATGDARGAIAALAPEGMTPLLAVDEVTSVGRLVRVALSDRFLEARRLATSGPAET